MAQLAGIGSLRGAAQRAERGLRSRRRVALGLDLPPIQKGLATFPGLAHRMQQVGRKGNVLFVNDSKATNADSAAKALACFQRHFLDRRRQAEDRRHREPRRIFPRIAQGLSDRRSGREFGKTLDGKVPYEMSGVLSAAVEAATRDAAASGRKEPVVLLSPACASFDQYPNFEVRGKAFVDLVQALPGVTPNAQ